MRLIICVYPHAYSFCTQLHSYLHKRRSREISLPRVYFRPRTAPPDTRPLHATRGGGGSKAWSSFSRDRVVALAKLLVWL